MGVSAGSVKTHVHRGLAALAVQSGGAGMNDDPRIDDPTSTRRAPGAGRGHRARAQRAARRGRIAPGHPPPRRVGPAAPPRRRDRPRRGRRARHRRGHRRRRRRRRHHHGRGGRRRVHDHHRSVPAATTSGRRAAHDHHGRTSTASIPTTSTAHDSADAGGPSTMTTVPANAPLTAVPETTIPAPRTRRRRCSKPRNELRRRRRPRTPTTVRRPPRRPRRRPIVVLDPVCGHRRFPPAVAPEAAGPT